MRKIQVKKKNIFYYFSILLLFLIILELFLSIAFFFTSSKYFENYDETMKRHDNVLVERGRNFLSELSDQKKIRIAVFGESSAAGFASPISFSDFIKKINNNIIIHNFSKPGSTFTYYQSEILKKVIKHYDFIIIYAGHNEISPYLYKHNFKNTSNFDLQNNYPFQKDLKDRLDYLDNLLKKKNFFSVREIFLFYRTANLLGRVQTNLTNTIKSISTQTSKESFIYPLYTNDPKIKKKEKKIIVENFSNEIDAIDKLLTSNQTLIISTVFSNDLFPPITDFINSRDKKIKIKESNNKLFQIYNLIFPEKNDFLFLDKQSNHSYDYKFTENQIKLIHLGAHSYYLSGINCIKKKIIYKEKNNSECFDLLKISRGLDYMPLRILPEINDVIRSKKSANIKIIDLEKKNITNDLDDYLSVFVDFQHPSSYGHSIIAQELAKIIFNNENIIITKLGNCDQFEINYNGSKIAVNQDRTVIKNKTEINSEWLINFKKNSQIHFLYSYYLNKNIDKRMKCKF